MDFVARQGFAILVYVTTRRTVLKATGLVGVAGVVAGLALAGGDLDQDERDAYNAMQADWRRSPEKEDPRGRSICIVIARPRGTSIEGDYVPRMREVLAQMAVRTDLWMGTQLRVHPKIEYREIAFTENEVLRERNRASHLIATDLEARPIDNRLIDNRLTKYLVYYTGALDLREEDYNRDGKVDREDANEIPWWGAYPGHSDEKKGGDIGVVSASREAQNLPDFWVPNVNREMGIAADAGLHEMLHAFGYSHWAMKPRNGFPIVWHDYDEAFPQGHAPLTEVLYMQGPPAAERDLIEIWSAERENLFEMTTGTICHTFSFRGSVDSRAWVMNFRNGVLCTSMFGKASIVGSTHMAWRQAGGLEGAGLPRGPRELGKAKDGSLVYRQSFHRLREPIETPWTLGLDRFPTKDQLTRLGLEGKEQIDVVSPAFTF